MTRERGLLLTPDNRQRSREGVKTQTRRVIKPQPWRVTDDNKPFKYGHKSGPGHPYIGIPVTEISPRYQVGDHLYMLEPYIGIPVTEISPRYQVGDHLYMLEPYQIQRGHEGNALSDGKPGFIGRYLDDGALLDGAVTAAEWNKWMKWKQPHGKKSSLYLFKSLARTWFEVTGVRCERVQDISPDDIIAEGRNPALSDDEDFSSGYEWFSELWDSINAKRGYGWDKNVWCWVYEYKLIERS